MEYSRDDLRLFIRVIWLEARGEGESGMRAVAHVIKNRIGAAGFPRTLNAVLTQRNAFSCLLPESSEYNLQPQAGDVQYSYCQTIAPAVLDGTDPDNTNGACYYANLRDVTSGWFSRHISGADGQGTPDHPLLATIGNQNFYK